jgi:hypothetical protein
VTVGTAGYDLRMRRSRPPRVTRSLRRLVAATAIAGLATAAVTIASTSGSGLRVAASGPNTRGLAPALPTLPPTPTAPPLPTVPPLPTLPPTPIPTLPPFPTLPPTPTPTSPPPSPTLPLPSVPLPSVPITGTPQPTVPVLLGGGVPPSLNGGGPVNPGSTLTGPTGGQGTASQGNGANSSGPLPRFDAFAAPNSSATSTLAAPPSIGLSLSPPPPVEQLTPLAGISFGQAPYLWPLFLLLDVIAAGVAVVVVRRTLSATHGAD